MMREPYGRSLSLALLILIVSPVLGAGEDWVRQRPLGEARLVSGPETCGEQTCLEVEVQCRQVQAPATAALKIGRPYPRAERGTILFFTGGGGTGFWEGFGPPAEQSLEDLRRAGYRTVQLAWSEGWLIGASGELEGQGRLACRPATVARWVFDQVRRWRNETAEASPLSSVEAATSTGGGAFCATGNSGGAAQVSYLLAHYGLADILSAVVPTGGPPMGRIDLGCIRDVPGTEPLWYAPGSASVIDRGFGFLQGGTGPCFHHDASFRERFREASLSVGNWSYVYPNTTVWFVFGENDGSNAVAQGITYYRRLKSEGSPRVRISVAPNTPHATPSTPEGASLIRNILLRECRPH